MALKVGKLEFFFLLPGENKFKKSAKMLRCLHFQLFAHLETFFYNSRGLEVEKHKTCRPPKHIGD
jgi:hypothetical protein